MDNELLQLALEAQKHPLQSNQRRLALNRLISKILKSKKLGHPQKGVWAAQLYEDLRNEAISKTLSEINRKIDKYNPEYPVMAWVNNILGYRFSDVVREYYSLGLTAIPRDENIKVRSLEELEVDPPMEVADSETQQLKRFIAEDPEKRLIEHIRDRPRATVQWLLLARLNNCSWQEISVMIGPPPISDQTLSSFLNRRLRKLTGYLSNHF